MIRFAFAWFLCMGLIIPVLADDANPPQAEAPEAAADKPVAERLKEQPDDRNLLNEYLNEEIGAVRPLIDADPDKAEKLLDRMAEVVASLEPTTDAGKALQGRAKDVIEYYQLQVRLTRVTLEDTIAKLKENPEDADALTMYQGKLRNEVGPLTRTEPFKAETMLAAAKELLASVKESATDEETKQKLDDIVKSFSNYDSSIATGKKLLALVGTDAIPLNLDTWINGEPLTDADLKGKVVLLDFWAVWCGPCVATFPHLREWHEEYADKGLVIIGLTRYYGYKWDAAAGKAVRVRGEDKPTPEEENDALLKFAESNNLHHRITIQKDSSLSDHYAVTGIPHVVVIDRQGKVQLIRVGSGEKNANDISEMLAKLIAE